MRRLASELGVSAMAPYRHVGSKDELLMVLVDRLAARLVYPPRPPDPKGAMLVLWSTIYDSLAEHPWVPEVLARRRMMAPSVLGAIEEIHAALRDAGLPIEAAVRAYRLMWNFTLGSLLVRAGAQLRGAEPAARASRRPRSRALPDAGGGRRGVDGGTRPRHLPRGSRGAHRRVAGERAITRRHQRRQRPRDPRSAGSGSGSRASVAAWATEGCAGRASAPWLPIGLDHGCAAKTWATAPPLKTVVLTDSIVSGAVKIRSPAPRTAGWMTRRYSSIKPVSTSDRAKRVPPWASRYPSRGALLLESPDGLGEVSGGDLGLAPVGGCERVREHDLGDLVHRLGEWAGGGGPVAGPFRVGGGTDEVRAGVAHGLDHPTRGVIGASRREPAGAPVE